MRHMIDFATISLTIPGDLSPRMKTEMVGFVENHLITESWMRAQSEDDIAAANSDRPDHGPKGAFSAWPAETAAAFCALGRDDAAIDLLHRVAIATEEGPFSQSRELLRENGRWVSRIASRGLECYNAACAASFAQTVIGSLFGFSPRFSEDDPQAAFSDGRNRRFSGELRNILFHDLLYTVSVGPAGRRTARQSADQ